MRSDPVGDQTRTRRARPGRPDTLDARPGVAAWRRRRLAPSQWDRRRLQTWLGLGSLLVVGVGLVWVVVTGLMARSQIQDLRQELPQLRRAVLEGRIADAQTLATRMQQHADRAHSLSTGPAWWVASHLPGIGAPLQSARVLAKATDTVGTDVVPTVVHVAAGVAAAEPRNGSVDLGPIARLGTELRKAADAAAEATDQVSGDSGSWFGPVSSARTELLDQLRRVDGELSGAADAVRVALPMLGVSGERRYFIGFLNEAESRPLGGIPGAYAIAVAERGRIRFERFGSDTEFQRVRAEVDLGPEFDARYGQDDPKGTFPNSDISPDFRDAARIWTGMWQAKTGQHLDGAIAVDPTALSYLLAVVGPARTADGTAVTAANAVALTQQRQYDLYGRNTAADNAARKRYLVGLARAASHQLTKGGDPHRLVKAVSRAARERRFMVWSADQDLERTIVRTGWGGVLGAPRGTPYAGFTVTNAAAGKLDYYLERSMTYQRAGCGTSSLATATLRLRNAAPSSGLPPYVTIRSDDNADTARPGDNRLLVSYYASAGARILSMTVDGKPVPVESALERGMTTVLLDLELPVGRLRTVVIRIKEPVALSPLQVLRQPLVQPIDVKLRGDRCGRS